MAWVYLDDQFPDHPKVALAGGDAGWLFVCGLAYAKRYATNGLVPKGQVPKLSDRKAPGKLAARLVEVGLWEDRGEHYAIHDYGDWNKPQASRSEAARKAARARWGQAKGDANAHANALPGASETHSETGADSDASECPPPPPPVTTSTDNSRRLSVPADDDDQQSAGVDRRVVLACGLLAERDLANRPDHLDPIGDPVRWLATALDRRRAADGPQMVELAALDPDATPEQLADVLAPPPAQDPEPGPPGPRPWASEQDTLALVTELHLIEPPPPDVVASTLAEAREKLAHPRAERPA